MRKPRTVPPKNSWETTPEIDTTSPEAVDRNAAKAPPATRAAKHVTGRFVESVEHALKGRRTLYATARALVEAELPPSVAGDVLIAVGFDPNEIYGTPADLAAGGTGTPPARRRSAQHQRAPVDGHAPRRGRQPPGEEPQQGALAGAVGPQHAHHLAGRQAQAHAREHGPERAARLRVGGAHASQLDAHAGSLPAR